MQSVFITGLGGFVGTALAERLVRQKIRVVGLAKERNYKFRPEILDQCSIVYGDLANYDLVRDAISRYEVDAIFHMGAIAVLRVASLDPLSCFSANIIGTANVLEAARQCKVLKLLYFSTDKVYGTQSFLPYKEDMSLKASDPYGTSKACGDLLAQCYHSNYGMNVTITRSGNIFGPGDFNLSRMVPGNLVKALKNQPLRLYKGAGSDRREYMFIEDVLDAVELVVRKGTAGEIYNVGGSGWVTAEQALMSILGATGSASKIGLVERDFIEVKEQFLDASKLQALGWKCNYSLKQGLLQTIPWCMAMIAEGRF